MRKNETNARNWTATVETTRKRRNTPKTIMHGNFFFVEICKNWSGSAGNRFFPDWSNYGAIRKISRATYLYIADGCLLNLWITTGSSTKNMSKKMGRSRTISGWIWKEQTGKRTIASTIHRTGTCADCVAARRIGRTGLWASGNGNSTNNAGGRKPKKDGSFKCWGI